MAIKNRMKFRQYDFYRCIKIIFSVVLFSFSSFAQTVNINIGQTQTSTSFRTSDLREGGNHLLFTPKRGWAGEVGVEYAIKHKSSFYRISDFKSKPLGRRSYIYTRCDRRVRLLV
jgi:hypothetical protein